MERPERVPQLYGYTVCLVALIWALTSALSIVEAVLSLSAPELRRRYEALRADRIRRGRFDAHRELITNTLSLAIAIAFFGFHWRWLRRRVSTSGV